MSGPFLPPKIVLDGFKERIEALTVHGDRLYVGSSIGNLHVYSIDDSPAHAESDQPATLVETHASISRRSIEQLGYLKDINSLVALSDSTVTLLPLPSMKPPSLLSKAKAAFSFALHTFVQHLDPDDQSFGQTVPSVISILVVGCRRKLVIYTWKDGEPQETKEAPLPHSPRTMTFMDDDSICFAYSPTEHALFSMKTLIATDLVLPAAPTAAATGMGAFAGFSGYMTLGLGAKSKPCVITVDHSEAVVVKDNVGYFVNTVGTLSRPEKIEWFAPPDDIVLVKPYIFSTLPPGSTPMGQGEVSMPSLKQSSIIQIRSSISLSVHHSLVLPISSSSVSLTPPIPQNYIIRLLTSSPASKSPVYFVKTPTDRTTATNQGSAIWRVFMKTWGQQIDELVNSGAYSDALSLLETINHAVLPDKDSRITQTRSLHAVSLFRCGKFDEAMDIFIELDTNPAKVVSLYNEAIAGRLATPSEDWIHLFGGPANVTKSSDNQSTKSLDKEGSQEESPPDVNKSGPVTSPSATDSLRVMFSGFGAKVIKDEDNVSITNKRKEKPPDDFRRSVETLLRYLSDRRPKVAGALATFHITPAQAHKLPPLSEASIEDMRALPNAPLSSLTSEQLLRFAQIVDTALFKSYLVVRPGLLGPLCRVENWCEVSEVEEELRARNKFSELIDLYNGKKMHAQALGLLQHLSEKETDIRDKLMPIVLYLQKLGPEYVDQTFETSRWVFEQDSDIGFEIFTSEDVELPRLLVTNHLETIGSDPRICCKFIEFLINERHEESPEFHDRLVDSYLKMISTARRRGDDEGKNAAYAKLLQFISTTHHYRTDRLIGLLPEDLYEARAILLGRLGRHDSALELYVYRLQDYPKAEEYCSRVYASSPTSSIFLTLLGIYLRPPSQSFHLDRSSLLIPALNLISRHSPRLDPVDTLQILPPLVQAQDVKEFLVEALRAPKFDVRVVREITKSRKDGVAAKLLTLEGRRVKVTDSRICPQCHKRLGQSVIAVHAPRGEVTHYQCREAFSQRLRAMRP